MLKEVLIDCRVLQAAVVSRARASYDGENHQKAARMHLRAAVIGQLLARKVKVPDVLSRAQVDSAVWKLHAISLAGFHSARIEQRICARRWQWTLRIRAQRGIAFEFVMNSETLVDLHFDAFARRILQRMLSRIRRL